MHLTLDQLYIIKRLLNTNLNISEEKDILVRRIEIEIETRTKEESKRSRISKQKEESSQKKMGFHHICPSCGVAHNKLFLGSIDEFYKNGGIWPSTEKFNLGDIKL